MGIMHKLRYLIVRFKTVLVARLWKNVEIRQPDSFNAFYSVGLIERGLKYEICTSLCISIIGFRKIVYNANGW